MEASALESTERVMLDARGKPMKDGRTYRLYTPNLEPIYGTKDEAVARQGVLSWEWDGSANAAARSLTAMGWEAKERDDA